MSYIIWDGDKCVTFNSKEDLKAEDYVWNNKSISKEWDGWIASKTAPNYVAVINQFDTKLPYANAPPYMQPKEQS